MEDSTKQSILNTGLIIPKEEIKEEVEITFEDDCEDSKEFLVLKEELSNSSLPEEEYDQTVMPIKTELTLSKEISEIRSRQEMLEHGEPSGYVEIKVEPMDEASIPAPEPSSSLPVESKFPPPRGEPKTRQKGSSIHHLLTPSAERPFSCQLCDSNFKTPSTLKSHMKTHTGDKPYSCALCHVKLAQKCNLIDHLMTHTGEKPYKCNLCKAKFAKKHSLSSHMMTHTGDKPFTCDVCQKEFRRKGNLTEHMRTHTAEKPYSCEPCHRVFSHWSELTRHIRTHTGDKSAFTCTVCRASFGQKRSLTAHMKIHGARK